MNKDEKQKLIPIKELFNRTWSIFIADWWKFILILGLPFYITSAATLILILMIDVRGGNPILAIGMDYLFVMVILAYAIFYFIAQAGMILSLESEGRVSVKDAYVEGSSYAIPLSWVTVWVMVIVGLTSLLLVPGLILIIRYTFAPYVLLFKGSRGRSALRGSRQLSMGYWWPIFLRMIIFYVIIFTVQIQAVLMLSAVNTNVVSMIIQPLLIIFMSIYVFVIYKDLEEIKSPQRSESPDSPESLEEPEAPESLSLL